MRIEMNCTNCVFVKWICNMYELDVRWYYTFSSCFCTCYMWPVTLHNAFFCKWVAWTHLFTSHLLYLSVPICFTNCLFYYIGALFCRLPKKFDHSCAPICFTNSFLLHWCHCWLPKKFDLLLTVANHFFQNCRPGSWAHNWSHIRQIVWCYLIPIFFILYFFFFFRKVGGVSRGAWICHWAATSRRCRKEISTGRWKCTFRLFTFLHHFIVNAFVQ